MPPSQLKVKLLAGAGLAAGALLAGAGAAAAAPGTASPPPKTPVITSAPASPGSDATPTWTFSDPNKASITTCSLRYGTTVVFGPSGCTSSATYNLAGHPYGTYTFNVTALVGNLSSPATSTYTFIPAPPTITSAPPSPGNDTTPTWAFTVPAGTAGRCSLARSGVTVAGPVACSGSQTFSTSGDGAYSFSVVAVSANGFTSAPSTSAYTLDTTPPPAPVITSAPSDPSTDDTPTWAFSTTGAVGATCSLAQGGTVVSAPAPCTSPATFDLTARPDAVYTFSVRAVDAAGNVSTAATSSYTLQRVAAPAAPTITAGPSSPGTDASPTWSFTTPTGTADQCTLLAGSTVVAGPAACAATQTYALVADGTYTFQVIAYDTVTGARSAAATSAYTLDRTPPKPPVFTSTPASPGTDTTPTWAFTTPAGATALECTLRRGTTVVAGPVSCSGSFKKNLTSQPDGTYTLSVVAIDGAGNRSAAATSAYILDRTPPGAPVVSGGPALTNSATPTWTVAAPGGATTMCTVSSGNRVVLGPMPCSGAFTPNLAGLPDGTYTVTAVATDAAGNVGPAADAVFTLDRTPPPTPTITKAPSATSSDVTPTWSFNAPGAVATTCTVLRGTSVVAGPVPCSSPATFDLSSFPDGTYTFSVVSVDAAGNVSLPARSSYTLKTTRLAAPVPLAPAPPPPAPAPSPTAAPAPAPSPAPAPAPPPQASPAPAPTSRPNRGPQPASPEAAAYPGGVTTTPTTASPGPVPEIVREAGRAVAQASKTAAFPLVLLALVILFLAVQDQIDRRDPKLAQAPVHAGEDLEFGPPPTRRTHP